MPHVFISYSRADSHFARLLKLELEKAGVELWMDTERLLAGDDWRVEIDEAIQRASALIVVMSPDAAESKYVNYEWSYALGTNVKVIPLLLKSTDIHPRLDVIQRFDFRNPDPSLQPWSVLIERLQNLQTEHEATIHIPRNSPPAVSRAAEALDSLIPTERGTALGSLARMNHPDAREVLVQALNHTYPEVREIAACLLGEFYRDKRAKPMLINLFTDREAFQRNQAIIAATEIWDEDIVNSLIEMLTDGEKDKEARRVCDVAAEALKRIGTSEALEAVDRWRQEQDRVG